MNQTNEENAAGIGLILKAAAFAADKHRNQRRKDARASGWSCSPRTATAL
jgi:hypothetical protein